jgi:hypothetical protein
MPTRKFIAYWTLLTAAVLLPGIIGAYFIGASVFWLASYALIPLVIPDVVWSLPSSDLFVSLRTALTYLSLVVGGALTLAGIGASVGGGQAVLLGDWVSPPVWMIATARGWLIGALATCVVVVPAGAMIGSEPASYVLAAAAGCAFGIGVGLSQGVAIGTTWQERVKWTAISALSFGVGALVGVLVGRETSWVVGAYVASAVGGSLTVLGVTQPPDRS